MYRDASKEFSRKVYDYMKKLHSTTVDGPGGGPGPGLDPLEIKLDSDGFPIVPSPASWNKISKDQLEKMYRSYLSIHYSMLTRGRSFILNQTDSLIGLSSGVKIRQVPFTRIAERQSAFFAAKYLPRGLRLDHPRTVKRDDIIKFFEHIGSRQASHGVKDAFRFKQYLSSRKKGTLMPAKYLDQIREAPEPEPELLEPGARYE